MPKTIDVISKLRANIFKLIIFMIMIIEYGFSKRSRFKSGCISWPFMTKKCLRLEIVDRGLRDTISGRSIFQVYQSYISEWRWDQCGPVPSKR